MDKTDKINKEIAGAEYENYTVGEEAKTKSYYSIGITLDFNDNRTNNGEQIYAIASDGTSILPDAPLSERQQVKEITVLYRGSTSLLDVTTNPKEVGKDWGENNLGIALNKLTDNKVATGQLEASSDYLKEIMEKYPNAKINIYGHSLGSMNAQYALANVTDYDRINSAHIYNGPNIYGLLSYDQKINASATPYNKPLISNF